MFILGKTNGINRTPNNPTFYLKKEATKFMWLEKTIIIIRHVKA